MMLFNIDWQEFLWRAVMWDRVSPASRAAFLRLKGNATADSAQFGDDFDVLSEHQFLGGAKQHRCRIHDSCDSFSRTARAMSRQRLFATSPACDIGQYLNEHFGLHELQGLCPPHIGYYHAVEYLARTVSSVGRVRSFLDVEKATTWERSNRNVGYHGRGGPLLFERADVAAAAKELINRLLADPYPVPFLRLPDLLPDASVDVIGATISGTLRYALLFAGMDDQDTPHIGLWPDVAERLRRPPAKQPAPVKPSRQFHAASALEDLTTLVVAAAGQPLRLRAGDGQLFAKVAQDLQPRLLVMPEWIPATLAVTDTETRLAGAVHLAEQMGLVARRRGSRPELHTTKSGEQWLAGTPRERLMIVLAHAAKLFDERFATDHTYGRKQKREPDVPAALRRAYGSLPEGDYVRWDEFLAWQVEKGNPYTELVEAGKSVRLRSAWHHFDATPEELEIQWHWDLANFASRLLPVGGLAVACVESEGTPCIALTDVGRFFLGQRDNFTYEADDREEGQVVVQPNFEVAFLSPAPLAEAALARFADRKGSGLGALFRLTKTAIFSAAGAGITCDQVLDTLRRVSTKELPKNVVREIEGWFGQCRTVTVKTATLIHCPDAATAARVVSAGGKKTELLTDTVVAVSDPKAKKIILQKLHRAGIFPDRGARKGKGDG